MASDEPESLLALTPQTFQTCVCSLTEQVVFFIDLFSIMVADKNYPKKLHDTKSDIIEHSGIFAHLHLKILKELFELIRDFMAHFITEGFDDFSNNIGVVIKLASDLKNRTNLVKLLFKELLWDVSSTECTGMKILTTEEADLSKHEDVKESADAKINEIATAIENAENLKQTVTAASLVAGATAAFIAPAIVPVAAAAGAAYVTMCIQDIIRNAQKASKEKLRDEMEKNIKNSTDIINILKGTTMKCIAAFYEGVQNIANIVSLVDEEIRFFKRKTDENANEENSRSKRYRFRIMAIRAGTLKEWCGHYNIVSDKIDTDFDQVLKDCTEIGNTRVWLDQKWEKLKQLHADSICQDYYDSIIETCNLTIKQVPAETLGEKVIRIMCG